MASSQSHTILLAHGSRDPQWLATFESGINAMQRSLQQPAAVAYMELASPSLDDIVEQHVAQGVTDFRVLPMFFAAGKHLQEDIPAIIHALEERFTGIHITLDSEIGKNPAFWQFLATEINATCAASDANKGDKPADICAA